MHNLKDLFDKNEDKNDIGINGKVKRLKNMLKIIDKQLHDHLINSGCSKDGFVIVSNQNYWLK